MVKKIQLETNTGQAMPTQRTMPLNSSAIVPAICIRAGRD